MSLSSRVVDLTVAVREKINTMMPRLLPSGGNTGQVLTKTSNASYVVDWVDSPGGEQRVYVQPTNPGMTGPGIWIQTGLAPNGTGFTIWFEDGL